MQELESLQRLRLWNVPKYEPKAVTQFSKMLIFINFHGEQEGGKRWIHQDYMDSLKSRDVDTPRFYRLPTKPEITLVGDATPAGTARQQLNSQKTMSYWNSSKPLARQNSSISARGYSRNQTHKELTEGLSVETPLASKPVDVEQAKAFPFKLNDSFGYWTIVITDGCYQILVPAKPESRQSATTPLNTRSRSQQNLLDDYTPQDDNRGGQATFSTYFNELRVGDAPNSGRASVGEISPMTFCGTGTHSGATPVDATKDPTFGLLVSKN